MSELAKILEDALSLKAQDRAALAQSLLDSLDELTDGENQASWLEEAERRRQGFKDSTHQAYPSAEVHARANELLG